MKIEVGKRYRTKGGFMTEEIYKGRDKEYPYVGLVNGRERRWAESGNFLLDGTENFFDLVEEYNPETEQVVGQDDNLADRYNDGKLEWDLVDFDSLEGLVRVLMFGKTKYSKNNWKKGLKWLSIINSMLRHIFALKRGEDIDSESGLAHTDHIMCNAMFLAHMFNNRKDLDDRKE